MSRGKARARGRGAFAFTLIELLTVIFVVAILAGFTSVVVQRLRGRARATSTRADLEALARGVQQFKDDFGFYPPSRVSNWRQYQDETPTPLPVPPPQNYVANFLDLNRNGRADVLLPNSNPSNPRSAQYEENGIELLILFLTTSRKSGPYFSSTNFQNRDDDLLPGRIFGSPFHESVSNTTYLVELYDPFDNPYVYISYDNYVSGLSNSVDVDSDGNSDVDGQSPDGRTLRPARKDPRTDEFARKNSYQLYSFGPNKADNLGFGGEAHSDELDNDGNGIIDDEDDISTLH